MRNIFAICLCVFLCGYSACPDPLVGMKFAGYTQLSPPSNLYVPGAVVVLDYDQHKRAEFRLVCGPRASLGAAYMPRVSDTVSSALKMSKTQRIELEADAVDRFRSRTSVEDVQSVSVNFENARVLEADDSEIFRLIGLRTPECSRAIEARQAAGMAPTMVSSAFIADVTYEVSFKRGTNLEKSAVVDKMGEIAAKLGGGHTEVSDHSIKAVNLVIGVKTDSFYMGIKPGERTQNVEHEADPQWHTVVDANPTPDAPLVPPIGGWASPVRTK